MSIALPPTAFAIQPAVLLTSKLRAAGALPPDALTQAELRLAQTLAEVGWFVRIPDGNGRSFLYSLPADHPQTFEELALWVLRELGRRDAVLGPLSRPGPRAGGRIRAAGSVEEDLAHLLQRLTEAYPDAIPRTRLLRWRKKPALDPLLNRLIDEGLVELVKVGTGGRPKRTYRATLKAGSDSFVESSSASLEEDASTQEERPEDWGESRRPPERELPPNPGTSDLFGEASS